MPKEPGILALCVLVPLIIGTLSGIATASSVDSWYPEIAKPAWTPPNSVFAPVWSALYLCMGFAAYVAWRAGPTGSDRRRAITLFSTQLLLNGAWSILFFGLRSPGLAFAEIVVLLGLILWTTRVFAARSRLAGWLMAPYLAWSTFATFLNFAIWRLNA